jgi:hypothetical protein
MAPDHRYAGREYGNSGKKHLYGHCGRDTAPYYYFLNGDAGAYTTNTGIAINETAGAIAIASATKAGIDLTAAMAQD